MEMPFGKYKGRPLERVPESYLCWCLDNCENLRPTLKLAIEQRLGLVEKPRGGQATTSGELGPVLSDWHRDLVMRWHPDRCDGDTRIMQALNDAFDRLQRRLAGGGGAHRKR